MTVTKLLLITGLFVACSGRFGVLERPNSHDTPAADGGAVQAGDQANDDTAKGGEGPSGGTDSPEVPPVGTGAPPAPVTPVAVACTSGVTTTLPALPELTGVQAKIIGRRARIGYDAFNGAADYRIYALPNNADVHNGGGNVVVQNATYHCAGSKVAVNGAPMREIEWPTLAPDSVVVVEALDQGCPYEGHLAMRAVTRGGGNPSFVTPSSARNPGTGELFLNGQFSPSNQPKAIARSFACLSPGPVATMDYFEDFSDFDEPLTQINPQNEGVTMQTASFDVGFFEYDNEQQVWSFGAYEKQLWVAYADLGGNAVFRATLKRDFAIDDDTFLHATMAVDSISTERRYPQLMVSAAPSPMWLNMDKGVTLVLQSFGEVPSAAMVQVCDHIWWAVNDQCPTYYESGSNRNAEVWKPLAQLTGIELPLRYDLYLSTKRAYVFLDGKPWTCATLANGLFQAGEEVNVTIGDALYHSVVEKYDGPILPGSAYRFHHAYQVTETRRVFDDVGVSEGVPEPVWDHQALPCEAQTFDW